MGLTNLQQLNLDGTQVTPAVVAELAKAKPRCTMGPFTAEEQ